VPWLVVLDRTASWRGALASGAAMAVAFCVAVFSWFPSAIADYAGAPVGLVAAIGLVASPVFQPQFVVFALARHAARRRGLRDAWTVIAGAGAYVGAEWAIPEALRRHARHEPPAVPSCSGRRRTSLGRRR
jgi:apolipoprotein N-acyltransferase